MRILGIDPGLTRTGFGIIDINNETFKLVDCGIIKPNNKDNNELSLVLELLPESIKKEIDYFNMIPIISDENIYFMIPHHIEVN